MFPLSFSSSSSLSSIPPSLDSISELDRALSDISEDDDRANEAEAAAHSLWSLPSNTLSFLTDQQLADLGHLIQTSPTSQPLAAPQTLSSEFVKHEEGVTTATTGLTDLRQWFSLKGVVKFACFILGFLSVLGKSESRCLPKNIFSGLAGKLNIYFNTSGHKYSAFSTFRSKLHPVINSLASQWTHFLAFLTQLPRKVLKLIPTLPFHTKQLHLPKLSITCPHIVSFSSLSSFSFSSHPSLPPLSPLHPSNFTASLHRYLLNPSPFFLPFLLALFLLVVMLTASQSVVLALILATPLGLTLSYLEITVSSRRKSPLPVFVSNQPDEDHLSSGVDQEASALTPTHTPPHTRRHAAASWIQEMCDPAA